MSVGVGKLDAVAKFNIYSWLALGHEVHIYTHSLTRAADGWKTRGLTELELDAPDARVHDLTTELRGDSSEQKSGAKEQGSDERSPKQLMTSTRAILSSWIDKAPPDLDPKRHRDYIFNVVDVTKSYLGATRQGITMDLKVGPSLHVQDYAQDFSTKFVSYSRGGKAFSVENQSMGTMQADDRLRSLYARTFDQNMQQYKESNPVKEAMYNSITSFHGRAWTSTDAGIDTATSPPSSGEPMPQGPSGDANPYAVPEIGDRGSGPFRVFKKASDQTNQDRGQPTNDRDRLSMMSDVLRTELKGGTLVKGYVDKASALKGSFEMEIRKAEAEAKAEAK